MDKLKRLRTPVRANISRTANDVDLELTNPIPTVDYLKEKQEKLEELRMEIKPMDKEITGMMVDANCSEQELTAEYQVIDDYNDRIRKTVLRIKKVTEGAQPSTTTSGSAGTSSDRSVKLPNIEILKFNGDLKGWLPFWSQFRKIHDDTKMPDSDKFQYLVQSMEKGSSAQEFIGSFTQTGANYSKAVEALRVRYGKEEVLKTVYIRDLLNLITTNAKSAEKMPLSKLYNKLQSQLRSLETLGVSVQQYAIFLHPMVESCLPEEILTAWQRSQNYGKDGTTLNPPKTQLDFLMEFLESEVEAQAMRTLARDGFKPAREHKKAEKMSNYRDKEDVATAAGLFTGKGQGCIFCSKSHDSKECGQSKKLSLEDKKAKIQKSGACYLCLKTGHSSKTCKSFVKCLVCDMKHLTLMCPDIHRKPKEDEKDKPEVKTVAETLNCTSEILLQTLLVKVKGEDGNLTARLMIDSGSQMSFVKRNFVRELGLQPIGQEVIRKAVFGGGVTEPRVHHKYRLELKGLEDQFRTNNCLITVLDEPVVCGRIPRASPGPWMDELRKRNIQLSDIRSSSNADIDILVGVDFMGMLMTGKVHQLDCGLCTAETRLGWTLYGKVPSRCDDSFATLVATTFMSEASVEDLWSLESIGIRECSDSLSKEEKETAAKQHFAKTVTRSEDGRYTVSLPWITKDQNIPNNRKVAEARLKSATIKLKNGHAFETYDGIFKQWLAEGIIEEVPPNEKDKASHYVPHRPVFKPESLTTPVRPVFDASCKTGRSPSLNDCLEKGPNIMELIPSLILRFRERKIGVLSDIRKAFQMINLNKEERDFLRFLWWEDQACSRIKEFRHSRVVFGVNCSPFLLAAVIEKHLGTAQGNMEAVAQKLLQSLYVDNCVTSVDSLEEYEDFKSKATQLMADAKMELRQWEHSIGEGTRVGPTMEPGCGLGPSNATASTLTSVLGLKWDKSKDELFCIVPKSEITDRITKRVILSSIQKIFDPMGFLAPALLPPKRMMQKAWAKEVSWDEELDEEVEQDFKTWWSEAAKLERIRVPRWSTGISFINAELQLHIFCDASQDAFAAAVFLRAARDGMVSVQLLQAKARVAPLKKVTIPRLELLSCTIAARLAKSVSNALGLEDIKKFYWSDSTTALAWIKRNNDWGTFVGNRVREICKLSDPEDWRHVPGILNPADLPSRGCTPRELLQSKWWEGPDWLKDSMEMWPNCEPEPDEKDVALEIKKTAVLVVNLTNGEAPWYCRRFSSYLKNVRMVAWVIRFIQKARKTSQAEGELTENEIRSAEQLIFGVVQGETVSANVKDGILEGVRVKDENGLIVVKTKLTNRQDNLTFVKPAVLPSQHPFVEQMIREEHLKNHHAGAQFLMSRLREKCWILQGRKAIKKIIRSCVICKLHSGKPPTVPEAPLPEDRVKNAKAFEVTGVDLAGPIFLKDKGKAWIVLFTCAVYRCVHLELVNSLSTDAFMLALHRFVSRRGRPTTIYSDNGTNFVGTNNHFKALDWKRIQREWTIHRIQWKFNPPTAAWWGGWWERLIRSLKDLLKRMLGHKKLNHIQMETCLCEVEAIMNARPLTYVTEDPEDLIPLTPAMFLQDVYSSQLPEVDTLDGNGLRSAYQGLQKMKEELRSRFRTEYLAQLIHRRKGKQPHVFSVGDVVHIGADNKKRLEWPLGKIVELLPGKDGKVRVAKVKTAMGVLLRPLQRLFPLEVSTGESLPVSENVKKYATESAARNEVESVSVPYTPEVRTRKGRIIKPPVRHGYSNISYKLLI